MKKKMIALALILALLTAMSGISASAETARHERVYIVSAPDGTVLSLTDSIRLENKDGLEEITDSTMLSDIQNVGGEQSFSIEDGVITWQAMGDDILYQGTSDKEPDVLPIIRFTLDGEEVTAAELAERQGKATLEVSYSGTGALPMLAVTAVILPEDGVADLQTENAAIVQEAGYRVLLGWAAIGLNEDLELPVSFRADFQADHPDFSWSMTFLSTDPIDYFCSEADDRIDLNLRDELNEAKALFQAMSLGKELPETSGKIKDVAPKINELNDGITELNDGASELADGAAELSDGAEKLKTGSEELDSGAGQLLEGLNTLAAGNDSLNQGAQMLFASILNNANSQLAESGLDAFGLTLPELTADNYSAVLDQVLAQIEQMVTASVEGGSSSQLAAVQTAYESLNALKTQLDQINAFVSGIREYTSGVTQAAAGAAGLKDGISQLSEGASALSEGAQALAEGTAALHTDGTELLKDKILDAEKTAAEKILPYLEDDLEKALNIFEDTRDRATAAGYDLRSEDVSTDTVYIIRTDLK